jgi:hypothetical protein
MFRTHLRASSFVSHTNALIVLSFLVDVNCSYTFCAVSIYSIFTDFDLWLWDFAFAHIVAWFFLFHFSLVLNIMFVF